MLRITAPATVGRSGWMVLGLVVGLSTTAVIAQQAAPAQQPAQQAPAQQAQAAPTTRLFANDGGMILNFIKPDKTADFEAVITKLKEALAKSEKPGRKEQAKSWKVFKSPDQ